MSMSNYKLYKYHKSWYKYTMFTNISLFKDGMEMAQATFEENSSVFSLIQMY